jgi:hypothetical protein
MKKTLFLVLSAMVALSSGAWAANELNASSTNAPEDYRITAVVLDSLTRESLPYVTCSVAPENAPQKVINRFAGDADGIINGTVKTPGNYILVVTFVGKQPAVRSFSVSDSNRTADLGKINMGSSDQALAEVDVVATRPLIRADADKIIYDAEQDPESKSSTVLDMLRKVPMVTVDGQDNVQLKGSSNFKFFLNGKPTNMFSANPGMILKSIPANMVKNVEVITQPGAKYDAEGVGGIINIVTIQQSSTQGYSANISAQGSSRGSYGGGVNLVVQQGKFSFSGNYNYMFNRQFPITTITERKNYVNGAPFPMGRQTADVRNVVPMQFGSGQLSYEIDTLNLVTFSFNRRFGRPQGTTEAETENFDAVMNGTKVFAYDQSSTNKQSWGSTDFGVDFQRTFARKKDELFTLSYKLSNTPNSSEFEALNTIDPNFITRPQPGLTHTSRSMNIANTNEHTFQADYTNPLAKGHTLEMGAKFIARFNDSESVEHYEYFNFGTNFPYTPYIIRDSTSLFSNQQDILGAYLSYSGNVGKWGFRTGLRYEYTWLEAKFNETNRNFNDQYGVAVPSASVLYRITDMKNFKVGYNNRIQRPGIGFLNPYVDRRDPNYINYGNPDLEPEKNHSLTATYSSFTAKYNLSAELSYSFVNNAIEQYSFIREGSTVQEITYGNIGRNKQYGLNLFGNYRGLKWLTLYTNTAINYVTMSSDELKMTNEGFTGRMFLGGTFMLPKSFRISTGVGGNLPQVNLQGSQSAFYFSYAALSKELLKKRLNISLSAVYFPKPEISISTIAYNATTQQKTFEQYTRVHLAQFPELRMNVSYRIGAMNTQVKKTKKTISNDDQKMRDNSTLGESPM